MALGSESSTTTATASLPQPSAPERDSSVPLALNGKPARAPPHSHSHSHNSDYVKWSQPADPKDWNNVTLQIGRKPWPFSRYFRWEFLVGLLLSLNFLTLWAIPVFGMGQLWKSFFRYIGHPIFEMIDGNSYVRHFAETYIYSKPKYADFFVTTVMVTVSTVCSVVGMFWVQIKYGYLPWWSIALHYCAW